MNTELQNRIKSKIKISEDGCWIWQGYKIPPYFYGKMSFKGLRAVWVHRMSYLAFKGDPTGLSVCHKCDNPPCCNPEHLFLGTQSDNSKDMVKKFRSYVAFEKIKRNCKRGHLLSGENLYTYPSTERRQCKACRRIGWHRRKNATIK